MPPFRRGLCETLITEALAAELEAVPSNLVPERRPLELGEAADRLALHVGHVLRVALEDVADGERVTKGLEIARALIREICAALPRDPIVDLPVEPGEFLAAILARAPDGQP